MKMGQGIGDNIRDERRAVNMTQAELAEKIGVAQTTVANWENGTRNVSVHNLQKIADALKIPIAQLAMTVTYRNGEFVKEDAWLDAERIALISMAERIARHDIEKILDDIPDKYFLGEILRVCKQLDKYDLYRVYKYVAELADN